MPPPWSTVTVTPIMSSVDTSVTVPLAQAATGAPISAAMSIPSWVRQSPMVSS